MAKTHNELKELKEEYEKLNEKLQELTEEELMQVTGGTFTSRDPGTEKELMQDTGGTFTLRDLGN